MPMTKNRVRVSKRNNNKCNLKNPASGGIFFGFQQIKILPGAKHLAELDDLADMVGVMIGDQ